MAGLDRETTEPTGVELTAPDGRQTFDEIIRRFQESNDPALLAKSYILEDLALSFSEDNLVQAEQILGRMITPEGIANYDAIDRYIQQLQEISGASLMEEARVREVTRSEETEVDEQTWREYLGRFFFDTSELNRIQAINIQGSVDSIDEFNERIQGLIDTIRDTGPFQSLTAREQNRIVRHLEGLSDGLERAESIHNDYIENQIDQLAQQVERQNEDGNIVIELEEGSIDFATKAEAFEFIELLQSEAETEFQGALRNISESIGGMLWDTLQFGFDPLLILPYEFTVDRLDDFWDAYQDGDGLFMFGTGAILLLSTIATANYTETLWRRVITDTIGRSGPRDWRITQRYRLGNFSRTGDIIFSEEQSVERNEYIQRLQTIDRLNEQAANLSDQERVRFDREIARVRSFLNVNTNTFWLKAYALSQNRTIFGNYADAFRFGLIGLGGNNRTGFGFGNIVDIATSYFNNGTEIRDQIERGMSFVGLEIQETDGRITGASGEGNSTEINQMRDYVRGRSDLSQAEKDSIIRRIDNFIQSLRSDPRGIDFIQQRLVDIVEYGRLDNSEVLAELERRYPYLNASTDTTVRTRSQQARLWYMRNRANMGPTVMTRGAAMAFRFYDIVRSGRWEGSMAELNVIVDRIEDGRLEFNQLYPGMRGNIRAGIQAARNAISLQGISTPQLTELESFNNNFSQSTLDRILREGSRFRGAQSDTLGIIANGLDIDGVRYRPYRAIENHIRYIIPDNNDETHFRESLADFRTAIEDGRISLSDVELFRELQKIRDGFVPSYQLLNEFNRILSNSGTSATLRRDIEQFRTIAQDGRLNITANQLRNITNGSLTFDPVGSYITTEFTSADKDAFIRSLQELETLNNQDFKGSIGSPTTTTEARNALRSQIQTEIELRNGIDLIGGNDIRNITRQLDRFADSLLGNDYSIGQAREIMREIVLDGRNFDDINIAHIVTNTVDHRTPLDIRPDLINNLRNAFNGLSEDARTTFITDLRDSGIPTHGFPNIIQEAIATYERMSANGPFIAQIERFQAQLERARTPQAIERVRNNFDNFTGNTPGLNVADPDISALIDEFETTYETTIDHVTGAPVVPAPTETPDRIDPITPTETPEVRETFTYNNAKNFLDEIFPSIMMLGDEEAIRIINQEYMRINRDASYIDMLGRQENLLDYYRTTLFEGREIFSIRDLNTNLEGLRRALVEIDPNFSRPRTFSAMGEMIRGTYNTDIGPNITRAIRELRLTR